MLPTSNVDPYFHGVLIFVEVVHTLYSMILDTLSSTKLVMTNLFTNSLACTYAQFHKLSMRSLLLSAGHRNLSNTII